LGPLTEELKDKGSLVREFLGERFMSGLREVQRRYRVDALALVVLGVPRDWSNVVSAVPPGDAWMKAAAIAI
jgi:hypothetical protein